MTGPRLPHVAFEGRARPKLSHHNSKPSMSLSQRPETRRLLTLLSCRDISIPLDIRVASKVVRIHQTLGLQTRTHIVKKMTLLSSKRLL